MLPLASVGFFSAGLFFAIFAYTFYSLTKNKIPSVLKHFSYAYFTLAVAFIIWGIASLVGEQSLLQHAVSVGNVLLLFSTGFLLNIYFSDKKNKNYYLLCWGIVSILFLGWRALYFPPQPFLSNGIFIFNTQTPVAIILGVLLLLVWLPTNIKVSLLVVKKVKLKHVSSVYQFIYIMATIAALLFIAAKTIPIIILSFSALVLCFIMLIASNILLERLVK